ncbi:MAG: SMC-Scp complex subunit ScpB [bacterium]
MIYSGLLNNYIDDFGSIVPAIEAVIFSSEEPVSIERLLELFNIQINPANNIEDNADKPGYEGVKEKRHISDKTKGKDKGKEERNRQEFKAKKEIILKALDFIKKEFNEKENHGIYLSINDNGISFKTKPEYFDVISGSLRVKPLKFTAPQLETLSIIAYKQPVTKNEIDAIRGFDSGSTVRFLLEKNLIRVAGRKEIVGRPLIYKTTDYFIEVFNLKNLNDLPSVKEMEDVVKKGGIEEDAAEDKTEGNEGTLFE